MSERSVPSGYEKTEQEKIYETSKALSGLIDSVNRFNRVYGLNTKREGFSHTPLEDELKRQTEAGEVEEKISHKFDGLFQLTGLAIVSKDDCVVEDGNGKKTILHIHIVIGDLGKFAKWLENLKQDRFFDRDITLAFLNLCEGFVREIKEEYIYGENDEDFGQIIGSIRLLKESLGSINSEFAVINSSLEKNIYDISNAIEGRYLPVYLRVGRAMYKDFGDINALSWENEPLEIFKKKWGEVFECLKDMERDLKDRQEADALGSFLVDTKNLVDGAVTLFIKDHSGLDKYEAKVLLLSKISGIKSEIRPTPKSPSPKVTKKEPEKKPEEKQISHLEKSADSLGRFFDSFYVKRREIERTDRRGVNEKQVDFIIRSQRTAESKRDELFENFGGLFQYIGIDIIVKESMVMMGKSRPNFFCVLVVNNLDKFTKWINRLKKEDLLVKGDEELNKKRALSIVALCQNLIDGIDKFYEPDKEESAEEFVASLASIGAVRSLFTDYLSKKSVVASSHIIKMMDIIIGAIEGKFLPLYLELKRSDIEHITGKDFSQENKKDIEGYIERIKSVFNEWYKIYKLEKPKNTEFCSFFENSVNFFSDNVLRVFRALEHMTDREKVNIWTSFKDWCIGFSEKINEKR